MEKIYPFKFLDAYDRKDTHMFFGRDEEIETIFRMTSESNILLVYGASGTGKTSLIQCGLSGKFESHDWLPLNIRRGSNINASLEATLHNAGGAVKEDSAFALLMSKKTDLAGTKQLTPLARSFSAVYRRYFRPIYLIFDQFEELFILGTKEEQSTFINTVRAILNIEQPVRMIFSIREEYVGHLYDFEKEVPQLMRKKLRVEPMNLGKVGQVIKGVTGFEGSNISLNVGEGQAITQAIFEKVRGTDKAGTIQLPYLQVFLDKLYMETTHDETKHKDAIFTMETINKMGGIGDILSEFLDEQVKAISNKLSIENVVVPISDIWNILSPFATLDGTKEPITMTALLERLPDIDNKLVTDTVIAFVNSRILRHTEEGSLYELMHDTLAKKIAAKRTKEEIALMEVRRLIKNQASQKKDAQELFSEKQLSFIDPYLDKIKLNEDEVNLLNRSRKNVRKTKLKKVGIIVIIITSILFAFLAVYAFDQKNRATKAQIIALEQRKEALIQKSLADKNKEEALIEKMYAVVAKDSAEKSKEFAIVQQKIATQQQAIAQQESMRARMAEEEARKSALLAEKSRADAEQNKKKAIYEKMRAEDFRKESDTVIAVLQNQIDSLQKVIKK